MWKIKSIQGENLFSYGEFSYDLNSKSTTLIFGINKTDNEVESNGSGKSSQLDIISIALTGDPVRKIVKEEMLRNEESKGFIEIKLENDLLKKSISIYQDIFRSKTNKVKLYENGELRKDLEDLKPSETWREVGKLLGVNKDDLFNYFLISKEKYQSLLKASDSSKKEVINRFSNANIIDPIDNNIKSDIEVKNINLNKVIGKITSKNTALKIYIDRLEEEKNTDLKAIHENQINFLLNEKENELLKKDALNGEINKIRVEIKQYEKEIDLLSRFIVEKKEDLKLNDSELKSLSEEIESIEKEILQERDKLNESTKDIDITISSLEGNIKESLKEKRATEAFISEIEANISDSIECPKCSHKFILRDKEYNIEEAKNSLPELLDIVKSLNEEIDSLNKEIDSYSKKIGQLKIESKATIDLIKQKSIVFEERINKVNVSKKETKALLMDDENKELRLNRSIKNSQIIIEEKLKLIEVSNNRVIEIDNNILQKEKDFKNADNSKIDSLVLKIDKLQSSIYVKELLKDELEDQIQSITLWRGNFKKFKSYLANTSIKAIENKANNELIKMGTNLSLIIDGFRELSNGDLKEEISISVSRDGLNSESFGKFSGGEKSKCDLAVIMAIQDLINSNTETGGLDLLFIDEILESNDSKALNGIVKSLSNTNKTIYMISHVDPDRIYDCNKMIVEKINKISQIKQLN